METDKIIEKQIRKADNRILYKGFYADHSGKTHSALIEFRNPRWNYSDEDDELLEFSYDTADVFLHGSCWLFSMVLQKEANLPAYEIIGNDNRLIHTFCTADFNGQTAFADILEDNRFS